MIQSLGMSVKTFIHPVDVEIFQSGGFVTDWSLLLWGNKMLTEQLFFLSLQEVGCVRSLHV